MNIFSCASHMAKYLVRQFLYEWVWLCPDKTLFTQTDSGAVA